MTVNHACNFMFTNTLKYTLFKYLNLFKCICRTKDNHIYFLYFNNSSKFHNKKNIFKTSSLANLNVLIKTAIALRTYENQFFFNSKRQKQKKITVNQELIFQKLIIVSKEPNF